MEKYIQNLDHRYKIFLFIYAAVIIALTPCMAPAAEKYPLSKGTAVNDFANVIDPVNAAKMESLAKEILQKTGTAIVVATLPELGESEEITLYVNGLYKAWGIGKKGEDKGVLIFLAVKERQIRIETGYGIEGILPDGLIGQILDRYVVPHLKTGQTSKALYNAMYVCGAFVAKDAGLRELTGVAVPYRAQSQPENQGLNVFVIIFFLVAAALLLGTRTGRQMLPWILLMLVTNSGRGGGGGFGGGFGGFGGGMSGGGGAGRDF